MTVTDILNEIIKIRQKALDREMQLQADCPEATCLVTIEELQLDVLEAELELACELDKGVPDETHVRCPDCGAMVSHRGSSTGADSGKAGPDRVSFGGTGAETRSPAAEFDHPVS